MAFGQVVLSPGVDTESTPTESIAGINTSNLIRWKFGSPEKVGGWEKYYPFSVGSIPRQLHAWEDLNSNLRLAVGATASLQVITNGAASDITPQQTTTNTLPDFSTDTSSATITIVDTNISDPTTDNFVFLQTPVSVGGLVLSGIYPIDTVLGANSYTITAAEAASAAVSNGGAVPSYATTTGSPTITVSFANHPYMTGDTYYAAVGGTVGGITVQGSYLVKSTTTATFTIVGNTQATSAATASENNGDVRFVYYVTLGPQPTSAGYGTGTYGDGGYGTGAAPASGAGTPISAVDWTIGNWGEILLACPQGGGIYQWGPESGFQTAQLISQAPISNIGMFVTMPQQIVVALGSSFTGAPQPMTVAWCDAGDFENWTPSTTTLAGTYTIPRGSRIIGGLQAPTQNLIWTDLGVWSMQFVNYPNVFGFNEIMSGCGLIGSHAAVLAEGTVFWMSQNQFFMMPGGGGPSPLPCRVWDAVFQNLNTANAYKIRAGANSAFNEIWWFYPSANGTGENDSYVKYNLVEREWDYGTISRAAWIDQSVLGSPIGGDPSGFIYQHEVGYNGDGVALNPYFKTGYWVIGNGEDFAFVDQVLPDFTYGIFSDANQTATPIITLYSVDYPNGPVTTYGPYNVDPSVNQLSVRVRGRQMAIMVQSQDQNSFWRLGRVRFRWAPDGRR